MVCITAAEIEQIAQLHAAQMAAKRKQRSAWTPTGRSSEEAIVEVELARRGLSDVSALGEFPGLGRVDISGNCLADLSGFSRCVELRWVKASANRLVSAAGVGDATKLKALLLDHNIITELGAISQLSALQTLDLSYNPLATPVEGLAGMRGLTTLVLTNCGLSSLPPLHGFERLTKLVLSANSLQQLPDTPDSPALRELRLDGNQIRQAGRIADPGLTSSGARLRLLDLSGNPLDDSADAIGSLSQVCMQLEVLSLNAPVGVNADCLAESQWAASLHHLPRLKTVNGKKWKRDKAKAPAQSNSPPKVAGDTSGGTRPHPSCATTPAAATDALREVLGGLGRHQLVRLIESMGAGVNLAKELRRLQAAGSADARNSSEVPESKKRRLHPPPHRNDSRITEVNPDLLSAGSEPVSKKKTTDRLTKKLGPDPMESDIAVITKRKAKKKHLKKRKEGHGDEM